MADGELLHHLDTTLLLVLYLSGPVLAIAAGVGLVVGLLQAVTQIQDQSLPQVLKLVAVLVAVALLEPLLAGSLVREAQAVLDQFPAMTR
jgi:type III secretion protein S